tara:strand:- start:140 stop:574 length:435 start_codon:yes stop_codon:yes gene_type:complete
MNKKQQMQDILKDTIDYYNEDPLKRRCVNNDGSCIYTWGDNHCAVGRYLKPEYQKENWSENSMSVHELSEYSDDMSIDCFLVEKAHGLDLDFWTRLQDIHDIMCNWEDWSESRDGARKYGLTDRGKGEYVNFQDKIAEGVYDNG